MATRRLTIEQQRFAEQAMACIPGAIRGFLRRHPCMRKDAKRCDLHSAAQLAVVNASFRYNPKRGAMSTYYGAAISHELAREVKRYRRHRDALHQERDIEVAGIDALIDLPLNAPLLKALAGMPLTDKHLIQDRVLSRATITSLARQAGIDPRTLLRRLKRALEELARRADDMP